MNKISKFWRKSSPASLPVVVRDWYVRLGERVIWIRQVGKLKPVVMDWDSTVTVVEPLKETSSFFL